MGAIQILTYLCTASFLVFLVARVVKYMKTPIHVRWELYPVAHEKGRAEYGGSYFEEFEWWKKPREIDFVNELKEMFLEIILLKGVYQHNRKLWVFSFPFHMGMYLIIAWLGWLTFSVIFALAGMSMVGGFGKFLQVGNAILGFGGLGLTAVGALGLLYRRISDDNVRRYSTPVEYLNLIFVLASVGTALAYHIGTDPWFGSVAAFMAALFSFSPAMPMSTLFQVEVVLGALLLAYMPLSRMGHFIAKYFLYHDVRWSDEPNMRGSKIEAQVMEAFGFHVNWSAPHIQSGKTWGEVGTSGMADQKVEESKNTKEAKA